MADRFDYTENDIKRALRYWEKMKLLKLEYDAEGSLNGICLMDSASLSDKEARTNAPSKTPTVKAEKVQTSDRKNYTLDELESFKSNPDVASFIFSTERYIGRPLKMTELTTIFYWYDTLKFPADVIEFLVETCISKGKKSLRYMDKVAIEWHKEGVRNLDDAKMAANPTSTNAFAVMRYFGITGRNLIETELAFIDKWTGSYGFTLDIIEEACKRTVLATQKPSFEYADRILSNWHDLGVHHLTDITKADEQFKQNKAKKASAAKSTQQKSGSVNKFNNFEQRKYNFEEYEQLLSFNGKN
jgi:DnaD/phage-associated family protein